MILPVGVAEKREIEVEVVKTSVICYEMTHSVHDTDV